MLEFMYRSVEYEKKPNLKLKLYKFFTIVANIVIRLQIVFDRKSTRAVSEDSDIIVSLTSFPARINKVHITVYTLLNQTIKPKKIILWLAENQFNAKESLPKKLLKLEKRGLEIRFCSEDLRGHKKYFYTLKEYPNDKIITVDDDLIYPKYTFEKLIAKSKEFPNCIVCNRGHEIVFNKEQVLPYNMWRTEATDINTPSNLLCPTGCGGVLYPSKCFHSDILDLKSIKELSLNADDLWLHAMAIRNGTLAVYTDGFPQWLFIVRGSQEKTLAQVNVHGTGNDDVIKNITEKYNFNWK